jgi:hypothetical protein
MIAWHDRILSTKTPDELLTIAREFLATLDPDDFPGTPLWLHGIRVKGVDDLGYWQARLVEEYCGGGALRESEAALVSPLLAFFTMASSHATHIGRGILDGPRAIFSDNSIPKLFKEGASDASR